MHFSTNHVFVFVVFVLFQEDTNELGSTGSSSSREQGGGTSEAERVVMYRFDDDEQEVDSDHHVGDLDDDGGYDGTSEAEGVVLCDHRYQGG